MLILLLSIQLTFICTCTKDHTEVLDYRDLDYRNPRNTVFPVIVAAVLNFFFEMVFSQPVQPTAQAILPVRLQSKGGY